MNEDDKRISKALKVIGFWSNRTNDAWAMGEADWAFENGRNLLMGLASIFVNGREDDPEAWEAAAEAVKENAQRRGIDPRRHKWHGKA